MSTMRRISFTQIEMLCKYNKLGECHNPCLNYVDGYIYCRSRNCRIWAKLKNEVKK
jgi:hypothetical protein